MDSLLRLLGVPGGMQGLAALRKPFWGESARSGMGLARIVRSFGIERTLNGLFFLLLSSTKVQTLSSSATTWFDLTRLLLLFDALALSF